MAGVGLGMGKVFVVVISVCPFNKSLCNTELCLFKRLPCFVSAQLAELPQLLKRFGVVICAVCKSIIRVYFRKSDKGGTHCMYEESWG